MENGDGRALGQLYEQVRKLLADNSEDIGALERKVYALEIAEATRRGAFEGRADRDRQDAERREDWEKRLLDLEKEKGRWLDRIITGAITVGLGAIAAYLTTQAGGK